MIGMSAGIRPRFVIDTDKAASRPGLRMSERGLGRAFAAACDQIQALVATEIEPLLEFTIPAIECEMLAGDSQSVTFEQGRTADLEEIILYMQCALAIHGHRVFAHIPTCVFVKIELRRYR